MLIFGQITEELIRYLKFSSQTHCSYAGEDDVDDEAAHLCGICIEN